MTQKDLEQFIIIKLELEQLKESKKDLEEKKDIIKSQIITDMPKGGGTAQTMEDIVGKIETIILQIAKKYLKISEVLLNIERTIEKLEPMERVLMRYRYICDMTFYQIGKKLKYSERHIKRLHKDILNKIA